MKKLVIGLIIGLVVGFLICGVVVWKIMPKMMLTVKKSNYDFEETFSRIENSIIDHDWDIQRIYDMQECMESYGYENIRNISIFSLCKPQNVAVILEDDKNKKVTALPYGNL